MSSTAVGREAEAHVAEQLKSSGHTILHMNWRTRWCEIDIVSKKGSCVYFTEVKYRGSTEWGAGLEYITPKKLRQMRFAAEFWIAENSWSKDTLLLGAEVNQTGTITIVEL